MTGLTASTLEEDPMSARIHTALLYRLAVPAWLVATLVAATIAVALIAALGGGSPAPTRAASGPPPIQPTSCIDSSVVGHC
jgi:hypothetical protein